MTAGKRDRLALFEKIPDIEGWSSQPSLERSHWASFRMRSSLVAKMRWVMLALLCVYGLYTTALFSHGRVPIFLDRAQMAFLLGCLAAVSAYNLFLQTSYSKVERLPWIDHAQVILDLLFASVLIHFTGGPVSWFWPVYLLVTIEAAFLLPARRDAWAVGAIGGAFYGLLLAGHYADWIHPVHMPFLPEALPRNGLFLLLMWCWVAILNSAVALIAAYLMSVIRDEHLAFGISQDRLQNFVNEANDLIFCCSTSGRFLFVNPVWRDLMEYTQDDLATMKFQDVVDPEQQPRHLIEFRRALSGQKGTILEGELISKSGVRVSVEGSITCTFRQGSPQVVWCVCRDITERKAAEKRLYHLAHFDSLTGLPNRAASMGRIESALAMAQRDHRQVAILFLDLDRFKLINDTLGHMAGDGLLKAVGRRLKGAVRGADTVARLGGDEFVVALGNLESVSDVSALASKLLKPLAKPFKIGGHEIFVTASMGISIFPADGKNPETLLKKADIAMYHAKRGGRNSFVFYESKMDENASRRLLLANGLRRALERGEFKVYYQPKHHPGSCEITSLEALLRWEHPDLGLLGPDEFIPIAEETGLILPLGEWVLRHVAWQQAVWKNGEFPSMRVAVNLSGHQIQEVSFASRVKAILAETGINPESLEFEITETAVMQNQDLAESVIGELAGLGIRIAIDDFGTGYSSLAHIKRFAVSALKIDKSFVRDLERNATDAAIATAIIAMAADLNLHVVAEGVETLAQLEFLRNKRCDEVQGHLFSQPIPAEKLAQYMMIHASQAAPSMDPGRSGWMASHLVQDHG